MSEWNYCGGITAILRDFSSELPLRWNRVGGITETIFLSAYVIPPRVRLCDSTQVLCLSGIIALWWNYVPNQILAIRVRWLIELPQMW